MTTKEAVWILGERLLNLQITAGPTAGIWPDASVFTGSLAAGLVDGYTLTCEPSFFVAAERAAEYFLVASGGNYYGDEAYALCQLSKASADPAANVWRAALEVFYTRVRDCPVHTQGYVVQFDVINPADAAFYLAHHVVAACYIDAADKQLWREALVNTLARITDDSCPYPVTGLAIATWALAQTGPLDATRIDRSGQAAPCWKGQTLAALPALVCSHQVPAEEVGAGSFYARFDHGGGPPSGYTEDLVFGLMALATVWEKDPDPKVKAAMRAARAVLLDRLPEDGRIRQHLWLPSEEHLVYAGAVLQALEVATSPCDLDLDGCVDVNDFARMAPYWQSSCAARPAAFTRADVTGDRVIDVHDLVRLANHWLVATEPRRGETR